MRNYVQHEADEMNHLPNITVVIPLYNGAQYIRRSVQSVLEQSYTDFELLVVDDGSTDCGGEIVLEFMDPRLRLVRQNNMGVSAARNKGILEGLGNYIAFLDADDEWDIGFLDAVVNLSNNYPQAGIYGTGFRLVFPKGQGVEVTAAGGTGQETSLLVTDYFNRVNGENLINASGVMIPCRVFEEVGIFKVGEHQGEDVEMWARIALRYPVGYDTRILFSLYQTGMGNKPRFQKLQKYDPKVKMLQEVITNSPDYFINQAIIRSHIKNCLSKKCLSIILSNNRDDAVAFMENSNASIWTPLLNKLINVKLLWPFMKLVAWIYRGTKSRLAMRIFGGKRASYGVMTRLIGAS
jgi:glycosyltransferase involved in cell wall biosynthesis